MYTSCNMFSCSLPEARGRWTRRWSLPRDFTDSQAGLSPQYSRVRQWRPPLLWGKRQTVLLRQRQIFQGYISWRAIGAMFDGSCEYDNVRSKMWKLNYTLFTILKHVAWQFVEPKINMLKNMRKHGFVYSWANCDHVGLARLCALYRSKVVRETKLEHKTKVRSDRLLLMHL